MRDETIKKLALASIFGALIIVLTFVPYTGYITIGPLSFTIIHIVVIIGAIIMGPKYGLLLGFFFGLGSLIRSNTTGATYDIVFMFPWVSVLPRMLFGFLAGVYFSIFKKIFKMYVPAIALTALLATITHTVLVLIAYAPTALWQLKLSPSTILAGWKIGPWETNLSAMNFMVLTFGFYCIIETILAIIVSIVVCKALNSAGFIGEEKIEE